MSVRMGRFGPFVQIGTKDDEDKPRFAGLRPGQKMDAITYAKRRSSCSSCRASWERPRRARRSPRTSGASVPT
jgi:hypothetical protein